MRRRIDAKRYLTMGARLVGVAPSAANRSYLVTGDVTFHGRTTLTFEHDMSIDGDHVTLSGADVSTSANSGWSRPAC